MAAPFLSTPWLNEIVDKVIVQVLGYIDASIFGGIMADGLLPFEHPLSQLDIQVFSPTELSLLEPGPGSPVNMNVPPIAPA